MSGDGRCARNPCPLCSAEPQQRWQHTLAQAFVDMSMCANGDAVGRVPISQVSSPVPRPLGWRESPTLLGLVMARRMREAASQPLASQSESSTSPSQQIPVVWHSPSLLQNSQQPRPEVQPTASFRARLAELRKQRDDRVEKEQESRSRSPDNRILLPYSSDSQDLEVDRRVARDERRNEERRQKERLQELGDLRRLMLQRAIDFPSPSRAPAGHGSMEQSASSSNVITVDDSP